MLLTTLALSPPVFAEEPAAPGPSVARIWDEQLLNAIRRDRPKPPVHARNLFHLGVAMWDAWATYDPLAKGYVFKEKNAAADVPAARNEAISFAAYRLLRHRFPGGGIQEDGKPCQPGAAIANAAFDAQMDALGYDKTFTSTVGDSPAAIGNRVAAAVIQYGLTDGANEGAQLCYPDDSGYSPINLELPFKLPGTAMVRPNRWQPLAFDFLILQNGIVIGAAVQKFVGVGWGDVKPFALSPDDREEPSPVSCATEFTAQGLPYLDPGCPPQLGGVGDETIKDAERQLIFYEASLDPAEGVQIDISPGAAGFNNPLGADTGTGHPVNPITGQPYPPNVVNRGDAWRVIAEFWADGPNSETPPGHWNTIANYVTDQLGSNGKKLEGKGKPLDDLEWDVKLYLAVNGAVHDAAIGSWTVKHYYDSSRPISLIRYMGGRGQSSDPGKPSYHPEGLPLEDGLIELITAETTAPGGKHEALAAFCERGQNTGKPCHVNRDCYDSRGTGTCVSALGQIAVRAWNGSPPNPQTQVGGVGWRRAVNWIPFQAVNFVTPPFPGYTSGHSTYSRSAAEVLTAFTGSPYFPGGLATFVAHKSQFLTFEEGPTTDVELQWATYYDASDQAAISRRYGGIHPYYDDYPARVMGSQIGKKAFAKALEVFGPDKVDVCHRPGGNHPQTITVDKSALQAHLNHGDFVGSCARGRRCDSIRDPH